ncbi:MAG: flagellar hook basal-body protein [Candidatus Eremiobacteraeota bacterium]|nr:flagellar hook basal-body protein [Candidatus Eremiobacteraeota bacterium]MBC5802629.1 flagellar hook basal-body protein [Candidatus Eremiobacteraeota bacterium]MBC5820969.1 flagellar hook basal-body protein [Candidatus Eremiobacteraeota bacterium]
MDGIELMATAMHAAQGRLDISAANLANVSSDGFHRRVARAALTPQGLVTSSRIDAAQGPLEHTGRTFDLAIVGAGGFFARERSGRISETRSGSFERNARGELADDRGRLLMGAHGPIRASSDAAIDARGIVREAGRETGRIALRPGTTVQSGFIETSNVDAVGEMVDVLAAQRAFETAQKTLSALDEEREKDANDVVRVKS